VQQADLPSLYCSAKIFLFPSSWDPWGVVANEACAAGQAVMVSTSAGVAGELVVDDDNGFVLPLSIPLWVNRAADLLRDDEMRARFSGRSLDLVRNYNYDRAAQGLVDAIFAAVGCSSGSNNQSIATRKMLC
jgi:glycosyltransferase involved in cell wall biosynthesis